MNDVRPLYGMECAKCTRPAARHDFTTGITYHVSPFARHCQTHPPRQLPSEVRHEVPSL